MAAALLSTGTEISRRTYTEMVLLLAPVKGVVSWKEVGVKEAAEPTV